MRETHLKLVHILSSGTRGLDYMPAKALLPTAQLTGPLAATERCMRTLA